ncbi:MAG: energy transducer TonB [Janthinobacterium lividum]
MIVPVLPAAAAAPAALGPVGKWMVHDADDRCVLDRSYGPADRPTVLAITPGTLDTRVGVTVLEPHGVEGRTVRVDEGAVTLEPRHQAVPTAVRSYGPVAGGHRLTIAYLPVAVTARDLVLADTVTIDRGGAGAVIVIAPGGSQAAFDALDGCEERLLHRQGLDGPNPALSRRPEPVGGEAARWFRSGDYPRPAGALLPFGHIVAQAIVAPDGSVGGCAIAQGSGDRNLDTATCTILRARGRYVPALDPDGRPVAAPVVVPVNWEPPRH